MIGGHLRLPLLENLLTGQATDPERLNLGDGPRQLSVQLNRRLVARIRPLPARQKQLTTCFLIVYNQQDWLRERPASEGQNFTASGQDFTPALGPCGQGSSGFTACGIAWSSQPAALLAAHHLLALNPLGRVPSVHDQLRLFDNPLVIVVGVVGHNQHAIIFPQIF